MPAPVMVKLDQPHGILGAISAIATQIDDGIEYPITLIQDVAQLETDLIGIAADPPEPPLGQLVKPGKTQVAAIKEHQDPCLQVGNHRLCMLLAVSHGLLQQ